MVQAVHTDFVLARDRIAEAAGDLAKLQQVDPFAECTVAKKWSWEEQDGPQIAAAYSYNAMVPT